MFSKKDDKNSKPGQGGQRGGGGGRGGQHSFGGAGRTEWQVQSNPITQTKQTQRRPTPASLLVFVSPRLVANCLTRVSGLGPWQCLLNKLKKDSLLPGVVFSFSKKKCEECADFLRGEDLNSAKEKSQVRGHRPGHEDGLG